jgi:hypothetical protein
MRDLSTRKGGYTVSPTLTFAVVRCRSLTFVAHGTTIPSSPDSGFLWDVRLLLLLRLPVAAVVEEDVEPGAEEEAYAQPGVEEPGYAEPGAVVF